MARFVHYVGRLQDIRGRFVGLPAWARALVWLAAVPGVALAGLSVLVLAASILALLLLALPVYALLKSVTGRRRGGRDEEFEDPAGAAPGRRRVTATVIESVEDRLSP